MHAPPWPKHGYSCAGSVSKGAVTGGETALAEANARAALAEARLFDFKTMLDDIREQPSEPTSHMDD
jgi:hypothetical protein